jgi:hypothetical protein
LGVYGDDFLGDSFWLTAGALLGQRKAAGESVDAEAKFPSFAPYLGIGFGHAQSSKGLGVHFDAGVAIGKAEAKITASPGLAGRGGPVEHRRRAMQPAEERRQAEVIPGREVRDRLQLLSRRPRQ